MEFKPTWLYVKRCAHCGLLYFGKTTRSDPYEYAGSGTRWNNHINRHGRHLVETLSVRLFKDPDKLTRHALRFSAKHSIADSSRWANLREEDGVGAGGAHSKQTRRKVSRSRSGVTRWYTNGLENRSLRVGDPIPKGFRPGRLVPSLGDKGREKCRQAQVGVPKSAAHRKALSAAHLGKPKSAAHVKASAEGKRGSIWFNDGKKSFQLKPSDPRVKTMKPGRLPMNWFNDGTRSYLVAPTDPKIRSLRLVAGRI